MTLEEGGMKIPLRLGMQVEERLAASLVSFMQSFHDIYLSNVCHRPRLNNQASEGESGNEELNVLI